MAGRPQGDGPPAHAASPFWERVRRPRFRNPQPRVLLFSSGYFLEREILSACARLGWPVRTLALPGGKTGSNAFVAGLLEDVARFNPDFALTVNHMGLDQQGALLELFERMALPLASWFVDNPRLILHDFPGQQNPWCALFTWDADTVAPLAAQGFALVAHLPLATDTSLFRPDAGAPAPDWRARVSFVGDSMAGPIAALTTRLRAYPGLLRALADHAPGFAASPLREARAFIAAEPELSILWQGLPSGQLRLDGEQLLTWRATQGYRLERVRGLRTFEPIIAGDAGWKTLLPPAGWRPLGPLDYYTDLPRFYPVSEVNFNATSLQMKGAVNQRVFDVPACGGFVLTDYREQLEDLFDIGREVACYREPGEIPELVRHYLGSPHERETMARAARERIGARHDYTHRLKSMLSALRRRYA